MSSSFETLYSRTRRHRQWALGSALAAIIVVPLAVAGLFAGALATADERISTIPAIVVNNDTLVTTTQPDGTEQQVLAGRQLVTELTSPETAGFAWSVSNSEDAAEALASGRAYAVLTVPSDFSASITSLAGEEPQQANLTLKTDDAHSYLVGSAAQSVGTAMAGAFGREITNLYLTTFYEQLGALGTSLSTAASGATEISTGVGSLASGLESLSFGAAGAASGASTLSSGVTDYVDGVEGLSAGLGQLSAGASQLSALRTGLPELAAGLRQSSEGFQALNQQLQSQPANAPFAEALNQYQAGQEALAARGGALGQAGGAVGGLVDGLAQSARGADQLADGGGSLTSGAADLAGGVDELSTGTASSAAGARQLVGGATELAEGLESGAEQASSLGGTDPTVTAEVVAEPVGITTTRDHPLDSISPVIGMVFVPVGLWIGALTIFLILRPVSALGLASTASTGRLVLRGLGQGIAIGAVQALAVVGLLHTALGVPWNLLPATLTFAIFVAAIFVIVHHALTIAFGRFGVVISLVLLALQLTSAGGLYPLEIVAEPFQNISSFLPLTWAVRGMQAIITGGGGSGVGASVLALAVFGVIGILVSFAVVASRRGAESFGFTPARAENAGW